MKAIVEGLIQASILRGIKGTCKCMLTCEGEAVLVPHWCGKSVQAFFSTHG